MNTRIYGEITDINMNNAKSFWSKMASENISLKTVLLGLDKPDDAQIKRNLKEKTSLESLIKDMKNIRVLDIGSGIGRWADNLADKIDSYDGIDYVTEFVNYSNDKYRENSNINFYNMSVINIDRTKLKNDYNLIIAAGVMVYINDSEIKKMFDFYKSIAPKYIYVQETVSLMDTRLTLKNFDSKELKTNYNAIYRTQNEYEKYFKDFDIIKTNLLLDDKIGGRKETNARWWLLAPKKTK